MAKRTVAERFWIKVDKHGPIPDYAPYLGPCWVWTASLNGHGYGKIGISSDGTVTHLGAHVWAWIDANGPVPDGLELDHLCRVHGCVRPSHLEAVTPQVNQHRGVSVSGINARKTHCDHGHPFAGANLRVAQTKKGPERICVACRREINRRWWARNRVTA